MNETKSGMRRRRQGIEGEREVKREGGEAVQ